MSITVEGMGVKAPLSTRTVRRSTNSTTNRDDGNFIGYFVLTSTSTEEER
jgi:hypothetical protein